MMASNFEGAHHSWYLGHSRERMGCVKGAQVHEWRASYCEMGTRGEFWSVIFIHSFRATGLLVSCFWISQQAGLLMIACSEWLLQWNSFTRAFSLSVISFPHRHINMTSSAATAPHLATLRHLWPPPPPSPYPSASTSPAPPSTCRLCPPYQSSPSYPHSSPRPHPSSPSPTPA